MEPTNDTSVEEATGIAEAGEATGVPAAKVADETA